MLIVLIFIFTLILFCIYGAFLGADRAQEFFNSPSMSTPWFVLLIMLSARLFIFLKSARNFGLLLIHLGCILILAGAMYGSQTGHLFQRKFFQIDKIHRGQMLIGQGQETSQVVLGRDGRIGQLPFSIKLNEFRIEYYEPKFLQIQTRQGQLWKFPIELNTEFDLGSVFGKVKILRKFQNFRIILDNNIRKIIDSNEPGYNPAIEVQIEYLTGETINQYVFENFGGHSHPQDKFLLSCTGAIRDFISDIAIVENRNTVARKNIEVNHPLHYGGYYFYQQSYDEQGYQFSILSVVSDSGLSIVYSGYLMLVAGVFWHFWLSSLFKTKEKHLYGN